jgi:hydroxypyruvate isomerase
MAEITRRAAFGSVAAAGVCAAAGILGSEASGNAQNPPLKGRLKQSVCRWCYPKFSLDQLCAAAKAIGLQGIDLLNENEWPTLKKYGLTCAMATGPSGITEGWNRPQDHDKLVKESERMLPLVKAVGAPNMIVFSGNRRGLPDSDGLVNCAQGLKRIMPLAEQLGVNVTMELLNSKRMHKDYQCDHTAWGVELCKRVGSERFKLLYDIFHMQIMEGDIIDTIHENIKYLAHFHTGGVPGRNELDDTQELNYRPIAQAILDSGFQGFVAHEFLPRHDPLTSLKQAALLCDV